MSDWSRVVYNCELAGLDAPADMFEVSECIDELDNQVRALKKENKRLLDIGKKVKDSWSREYHTKGMYSEEEVKKLCSKAALIHFDNNNLLEQFEKWFDQNKKK